MPPNQADKRTRLIHAAAKSVYEQGFSRTTLADIAGEADVPLGNVYYYFKTKDALGEALIEQRADDLASLRTVWERNPDPRARLLSFIAMTRGDRASLAKSGCPIGTLCSELQKEGGPLAAGAARIFAELLDWLEARFSELGRESEARGLAVHLLSALQGVSLLAHSFSDPDIVIAEAHRLEEWVRAL
jgi:TetR/AcrR family transcriptional repressor of nem operon